MQQFTISEIHGGKAVPGRCQLSGWVKTHRRSKNVAFIELTDGSSVKGLQLVIDPELPSYAACAAVVSTGAALRVVGELVESPAKGQLYECRVDALELLGEADPEKYPLQKKGHTLEFLREKLHLRPRSNTLGAVFRIRSRAAMCVHEFFQSRGFYYITTPIITTSDCEGAGELFRVTTLDLAKLPFSAGKVDFTQDFFKDEASLTVSGQLEAEIFATALAKVYTFGPTFRAENSNTTRHLSEFWMIEPEAAFFQLEDDMHLAERFIVYLISELLSHCEADLNFLYEREWAPKNWRAELEKVVNSKFEVLEYGEAIGVLQKSGRSFEFPVHWGMDLQSEHEKYLSDEYVGGPLFVINYPKEIKAFYMRLNDDGRTVRAMDLLVPHLGEIVGGSQREERREVLCDRIKEMGLPLEPYWWYLELREFGTVPHAGFGLGFERFLMYITGMQNIRDVIPCPRFPGFAKF